MDPSTQLFIAVDLVVGFPPSAPSAAPPHPSFQLTLSLAAGGAPLLAGAVGADNVWLLTGSSATATVADAAHGSCTSGNGGRRKVLLWVPFLTGVVDIWACPQGKTLGRSGSTFWDSTLYLQRASDGAELGCNDNDVTAGCWLQSSRTRG